MNKSEVDRMTLQEACDHAVKAMVKQGKPCYIKGVGCRYAAGEGNHCAVGFLLDPEKLDLNTLRWSVGMIVEENPDPLPELIKNNVAVFNWLQEFHDVKYYNPTTIALWNVISELNDHGIDTSAPHWQEWIDLKCGGEDE